MGIGRCQAPNLARLVGQLLVIVSYILISFKKCSTLYPTHTHKHASNNQHGIKHPITLTYIYHASHIITNPNIHLSWHLIITNPSMQLSRHHIKPSIHLPYISSHYIQDKNMYISRQKHTQATNKSCYHSKHGIQTCIYMFIKGR